MPRPQSSDTDKQTAKISTNVTEAEKAEFEAACAAVDDKPAEILKALRTAFVRHVLKYGRIEKPIRFEAPKKR